MEEYRHIVQVTVEECTMIENEGGYADEVSINIDMTINDLSHFLTSAYVRQQVIESEYNQKHPGKRSRFYPHHERFMVTPVGV